MLSTKKNCSNHPRYKYSGKESSPLGLGLAAEPFVYGTILEGRDKTNWIVAQKNGVKVWSRITRLSELREHESEKENIGNELLKEEAPKKKPSVSRKKAAPPQLKKEEEITDTEVSQGRDAVAAIDTTTDAAKSPTKRKPTNYNIYMKYKLKQLVREETSLKPKERIAHAVALWQSMTSSEKDAIVKEALDALETVEA